MNVVNRLARGKPPNRAPDAPTRGDPGRSRGDPAPIRGTPEHIPKNDAFWDG